MIKYTEEIDSMTNRITIRAELENGLTLSIPMDESNPDYQAYLASLKDAAN